ncbi:hypothetical protein MmTuc01_0556 [Methanosarcina mazei Tuc01]|uniref:Uncharacterized protein n=1 Tax=Methanosarcina mazei Tuc01 TaxID=1236903 RepID=M1PUV6_METMZ|nr:hypothetical protein MmTuc01_0556 [Methanosarcina mazei Tuc01]
MSGNNNHNGQNPSLPFLSDLRQENGLQVFFNHLQAKEPEFWVQEL